MKEPWLNFRSRKSCSVCRVHKTFSGAICPSCARIGYRLNHKTGKIKRKK